MKVNEFGIKPYDESLGLSIIVDTYNQMIKHLNPEITIRLTEELAITMLGTDTVLTRDYLTFENKEGEIIAFTGLSILPIFKDVHVAVYGVKPEYFESKLPEELIDATLDLKNKLNIPEIIFQTGGDISKPFDDKLMDLGYNPVNYTWSMRLDNFDLFSHPGVPKSINIRTTKEMEDYSGAVKILNEAFADSFKYKPVTKGKWKRVTEGLKKNHIVEHCVAYDNENFIGMCDIIINPEQAQMGSIGNFGVLPSYQHQKIGSAILASGIETLREKGCKTIKLGVDTKNETALNLYKKFGFYVKKNLTQKTYQIN